MYDNQLVLYNNLSQRQVCELDHVEKLQSPADKPTQTVIFEEKLSKDQNQMPGILTYKYENITTSQPVRVPKIAQKDVAAFQATTFDKVGLQGPPMGVSQMDWSFDSTYLATKNETMP